MGPEIKLIMCTNRHDSIFTSFSPHKKPLWGHYYYYYYSMLQVKEFKETK